MPKVSYYNEKNLRILFQHLKNFELANEWKNSLSKVQLEPNDLDDEDVEFLENELEMLKLKSNLKTYFNVLSHDNFKFYVSSTNFAIVFFYLPCKYKYILR